MSVRRVLTVLSLPAAAMLALVPSASAGAPPSDTSSSDSSSSSHHSSSSKSDCSGARKVIHATSDRDSIDANDDNTTWDGSNHKVGWVKITGHCVTVKHWHVTDKDKGIQVSGDHATVIDNQID